MKREWTNKEVETIQQEYPTSLTKDIAEKLGRTTSAVQQKAFSLGVVKKVFMTRLMPGHAGCSPVEVGTSRLTAEGYTLVKIGKNNWKLKQQVVWEKHNGKPPKGMNVSFKDGDRTNCDIDNLHLVSRQDQMLKNSVHNLPEDLRQLIHLKSSLQLMVNKRRKKHEQQHADATPAHLRYDGRTKERDGDCSDG